jgi:2,5-furandicarboxylate decarboxylase 1
MPGPIPNDHYQYEETMRDLRGLKEFVDHLDDMGELQRITVPVDPRFEIPAVLDQIKGPRAPAVLFEKVKGHAIPVVGNLLGTERRMALALGVEEGDVIAHLQDKLDKKITPFLITEENERVTFSLSDENAIQEILPILTHYARDSGPYITSAVTSAKYPDSDVVGRGLHRIEIRGNTTAGISLVNPPLSNIYEHHKKAGTRMEVAIAVGVDPAILLGTVLKAPKGVDKFANVGGLMGGAVATVRAKTVDIEIPAFAEIVLEGYIDPEEGEKGGILGEVSGYYMSFPSPTVHITTISLRRDAVYHGLLPKGSEVEQILSFVWGLKIIPTMKSEFPSIRDLHFVPDTFGTHLVMSTSGTDRGENRRAVNMALSFSNVKKAVIVDDDVDISNPLEVEWAMATRFQADRDLMVLSDLKGQPIDPSTGPEFISSKIGVDATKPDRGNFDRIRFPDEIENRLTSIIGEFNQGD